MTKLLYSIPVILSTVTYRETLSNRPYLPRLYVRSNHMNMKEYLTKVKSIPILPPWTETSERSRTDDEVKVFHALTVSLNYRTCSTSAHHLNCKLRTSKRWKTQNWRFFVSQLRMKINKRNWHSLCNAPLRITKTSLFTLRFIAQVKLEANTAKQDTSLVFSLHPMLHVSSKL